MIYWLGLKSQNWLPQESIYLLMLIIQIQIYQDTDFFCLKQGLQRRISLTVSHFSGPNFSFKGISQISIGRVRTLKEISNHQLINSNTLSLNILSQENNQNTPTCLVESAWDSSLHNSIHLNRVTGTDKGDVIVITYYAQIEVEQGSKQNNGGGSPKVLKITKDLFLKVFDRDFAPSKNFLSLFTSKSQKSTRSTKITGVYEVTVKPEKDKNEIADTSSVYVRGEEILEGWRPRGVSLIDEHQAQLERLHGLAEVEKTRQYLALRERLHPPAAERRILTEEDAGKLTSKVIGILTRDEKDKRPQSPISSDGDQLDNGNEKEEKQKFRKNADNYFLEVIEVSKSQSPISFKGYMNFLEKTSEVWTKVYLVVRRPYICIHDFEDDPVERLVINTSFVKILFSPDQAALLQRPHVFSIYTKYTGYLLQGQTDEQVQDCLYAIDPLSIGLQHSRTGVSSSSSSSSAVDIINNNISNFFNF